MHDDTGLKTLSLGRRYTGAIKPLMLVVAWYLGWTVVLLVYAQWRWP